MQTCYNITPGSINDLLGWGVEFICASFKWHKFSSLILSKINGVIDMIMIPYLKLVIFHCQWLLWNLLFYILSCCDVTADAISYKSFILMTHLAPWKPLVRSRYLWSSCMTLNHLCSCSDTPQRHWCFQWQTWQFNFNLYDSIKKQDFFFLCVILCVPGNRGVGIACIAS